jgi:hypothetical protein
MIAFEIPVILLKSAVESFLSECESGLSYLTLLLFC